MERTNQKETTTFSILDVFFTIARHRWLIVISSATAAVLIFIFALISTQLPNDLKKNPLPNYYKPQVQLMIQQSAGLIESQISSSRGALSILMGGAAKKSAELILTENLLTGNLIKDQIAEEFDFYTRYELQNARFPKSQAREIFDEAVSIDAGENLDSNMFMLTYLEIDPVFATQVLQRIVELLEAKFKELSLDRVLRTKKFIEDRLAVVGAELENAQTDLLDFQQSYGIIDISRQSQEQTNLIADLQADIIRNELEIKSLSEYLPANDPKIVRLEQEIEQKKKMVSGLKTGTQEFSGDFIPQDQFLDLTTQYLNLQSELEIKKSIFKMLREEYEKIKIEENDNSRTLQIIESAEVPERKSWPRRSVLCIAITFATFFIALFWAFIKEYGERIKQDPVESEKLGRIKALLAKRKRED